MSEIEMDPIVSEFAMRAVYLLDRDGADDSGFATEIQIEDLSIQKEVDFRGVHTSEQEGAIRVDYTCGLRVTDYSESPFHTVLTLSIRNGNPYLLNWDIVLIEKWLPILRNRMILEDLADA
ncbi:MAG: hypothetical protein AB7L09_01680 [Nitrospira sp.]